MINGKSLEAFQLNGTDTIADKLKKHEAVLAVSPTGSGKSVMIANIAYRYIIKSKKKVAIFVHRTELLGQVREKLYSWYGIVSQEINRDTKSIQENVEVYVCMVETFDRRADSAKFLSKFHNVGLTMFDEAHLSNFKKIFVHFPNAKRIGWTATPIAANKKDPLKLYYDDIVVISSIQDLITFNEINPLRGVVPCNEWRITGDVKREDMKSKGQDFDDDAVGEEFSKKKQIENTLSAYLKYSYGKKTICFNANVAHSLKMTAAFVDAGLNARHIDGNATKAYREEIFGTQMKKGWLELTPNAILCNVGIATIGTDVPSVETIIVNKMTKSLTLFKQMIGRGGRPYQYPDGSYKTEFLLLDMGDNIMGGGLGRYQDPINWENAFWRPNEPIIGSSTCKTCPQCGSINYSSARVCAGIDIDWLSQEMFNCDYVFNIDNGSKEDDQFRAMVKIGAENIDVDAAIEYFKDKSDWFVYHKIISQIAGIYRKSIESDYLDSVQLEAMFDIVVMKIKEWFKKTPQCKRFPNYKYLTKQKLIDDLRKVGFSITAEELAETTFESTNKDKALTI